MGIVEQVSGFEKIQLENWIARSEIIENMKQLIEICDNEIEKKEEINDRKPAGFC